MCYKLTILVLQGNYGILIYGICREQTLLNSYCNISKVPQLKISATLNACLCKGDDHYIIIVNDNNNNNGR